jgi:CheY-like chemotaxis protein
MSEKKVLVVEDNAMNLQLIKLLLKGQNCAIYEATNGQEALDRLTSDEFDLVLMDIQLPGMDGLTVTRMIKESPKSRNTPIIALTAYAMKGDEEKAREAGCDGYIAKPIDTEIFLQEVARFLNK